LDDNHLPYPKYALITHWHWDHTFGMHAFNGETIVSSLTNKMLKKMKEYSWDEESVLKRLETKEEIEFAYKCMKKEYVSFLSNLSFTTYIPGHDVPMSKEKIIQILRKFCDE